MLCPGCGTEQEEAAIHQGEGEVVSHGEETGGSKVSGQMQSSVDVVADDVSSVARNHSLKSVFVIIRNFTKYIYFIHLVVLCRTENSKSVVSPGRLWCTVLMNVL